MTDGKILANDGLGSDVFQAGDPLQFLIQEDTTVAVPTSAGDIQRPTPILRSSSHPQASQWYSTMAVVSSWTATNAIGYSYSLTSSPTTIPDDSLDTHDGTATLTADHDGLWYVHVRALYASGWSGTAHLPVRIDHTAPAGFILTVQQDRGLTDPTPAIQFFTNDNVSGVQRYTLSVDNQAPIVTGSPYIISGLLAGEHHVVVTAYDGAGNATESRVSLDVVGHAAPVITSVSSPALLLERVTVRGTAVPGDIVTVYVDGVVAGQTSLPMVSGTTLVTLPWSIQIASTLAPGQHRLTATSTASDGQVSPATDPREFRVIGHAMIWNGRPIATFAFVTPLVVGLIIIAVGLVLIITQLLWSIIALHRREMVVEGELETLRQANRRQPIPPEQLDITLGMIESDLQPTRRRTSTRRRKR
jgi:hypothetical protein